MKSDSSNSRIGQPLTRKMTTRKNVQKIERLAPANAAIAKLRENIQKNPEKHQALYLKAGKFNSYQFPKNPESLVQGLCLFVLNFEKAELFATYAGRKKFSVG